MIERIKGRLAHRGPTDALLDAGPFRLRVAVPLTTGRRLPEEGSEVELLLHLQWKEDGPTLYGFATKAEREFFRLLILVPGVGPRIALSILSHLPPDELARQIRDRSVEGLTRVPGIGPKTAGRILVELGPRVDRIAPPEGGEEEGGALPPATEDAVQALAALGYPAKEARKAVGAVLQADPGLPLDECLRRALRRLIPAGGR